jgi:hypothetical protein
MTGPMLSLTGSFTFLIMISCSLPGVVSVTTAADLSLWSVNY